MSQNTKNLLRNKSKNSGFTLVESLIYVFIFIVVSTSAVGLLFSLNDLFVQYKLKQNLLTSGTATMERLLIELRQANEVSLVDSTIASSTAAVLVFDNATDTIKIQKTGNQIEFYRNDIYEGVLHTSAVEVPQLTFYHYEQNGVELVRIYMRMQSSQGSETEEWEINGGAILRGSYATS